MVSIHTAQELDTWRESLASKVDPDLPVITVCGGTGCRVYGSEQVWTAFQDELTNQKANAKLKYDVKVTGCHGFCEKGPLVVIHPQGIMYTNVKVSDVEEIVGETIVKNTVIERLLYVDPQTNEEIKCEQDVPFYKHQHRLILGLNGLLDPTRIEEYISQGGFASLKKVLTSLSPDDVIEEMKKSGLRGRGGAGFPTGFKWELCRQQPGDVKYVICNADEGDPGAYMDRSIMEGNPHLVLEGMIIGAYAMGANQGYVYIRNEYPLAVKHLRKAISQAEEVGLLGENILDSGFDFTVKIKLGSGAFVCGEETALIASIEGQIGEPRPRPPYPAEFGLWGKPTNKGTVIFSVVGNINNTGLVEVPIGISLRELIFDIGGGIPDGKSFKAAQIGGPSGGCIPAEHLDIPIDYESLQSLGAIMGSGGLVVADEDTCMVDFAAYFMRFTQEESCGKCVPCRVGTKAMLETLERICAGDGRPGDVDYLIELGEEIKRSSLCGLGQTAPNPVLSTIRYFRDEYEAHIVDKTCPARVCKGLITYSVIDENCTGCMVCLRNCPEGAIQGEKKEVHVIDAAICTRCGMCMSVCKFDAILVE
jgi:NADH-quinone oxidoreductase subunit F